jgi:hypothetical protein
MTIFGFNTDVKYGDVAYHVQSEARSNDLLLQTLVFLKGQCVGKQAFSYAERTLQPDFSEGVIHELLKLQHKRVIDAIQHGQVESVSGAGEVEDVGGSGLALKWVNSSQERQGNNIIMRFHVLDTGQAVAMAEVTVWPCAPTETAEIARALTDAAGNAALVVPLIEEVVRDSAVMARATRRGKSVTRKFRLRK